MNYSEISGAIREAQEHGRLRGREDAVTEHRAKLREFCAWLVSERRLIDAPVSMIVVRLRELGLWVDP